VIAVEPAALARRPGWPYLKQMLHTVDQMPISQSAAPERRTLGGVAFGIVIGSVVLVAAMLLAASVLWVHYGTAVFFEMITSGIAACF
jgi:hypothetical protein